MGSERLSRHSVFCDFSITDLGNLKSIFCIFGEII